MSTRCTPQFSSPTALTDLPRVPKNTVPSVHRRRRVDAGGVGLLPDRRPGVDIDAEERALVVAEEGHAAVDRRAGVDRGVRREVVHEVEEVATVRGDVGHNVVVVGLGACPRRRVAELAPVVGDDDGRTSGVPEAVPARSAPGARSRRRWERSPPSPGPSPGPSPSPSQAR